MLKIGAVLFFEGCFFTVEKFCEEGLWEGAPALYLCKQLLPSTSFTEHDRAVGLPGCTLVSESSWEQSIPDYLLEHLEAPVLDSEPVYLPAAAAETLDVVGVLRQEKLDDCKVTQLRMLFDPKQQGLLTNEDALHRDGLKQSLLSELALLWKE